MAEELRMALVDVLRKAGVEQADFLREGVRVLAQELMELEVAEQLGAERHERTAERHADRQGNRSPYPDRGARRQAIVAGSVADPAVEGSGRRSHRSAGWS